MSHAKPGDEVRLGTCIGHGMEPQMRTGRLVGIRKSDDIREIERYIIREYEEGDGEFPTGKYYTTAGTWLIPHTGKGCPK